MNPYRILDISDDATSEEIECAYRKQAAKYHPDMGGDAWAFQQVRDAYNLIKKARSSDTHQLKSDETESAVAEPATVPNNPSKHNTPFANPSTRNTTTSSKNSATSQPVNSKVDDSRHWFWRVFFQQLPLQNETTTFILVNVLDVFMTYMLMRFGAIEANPIANFFFKRWNFDGMIFFKMGMVAVVAVLAQIVARRDLKKARFLLYVGTLIVGTVVVYSAILFARHFLTF